MKKLRLITRQQETFQHALADQLSSLKQVHPEIEVECTFLPVHELFELMVEGSGCASGDWDIFLSVTDWLPDLIHRKKLTCLDHLLAAEPPVDFPFGWHPAMLSHRTPAGELYGLPWHDGPEVLHYRRDLFEDPQEKMDFEIRFGRKLDVPTTWAEFIDLAQFFTRPSSGLWGCVQAAYTDGHNNVYDFLIQLWSRNGQLFSPDFRPAFNSQIGIEALQFYYDLFFKYRVASPACLQLGSVECGDAYAQGTAAMSWNWLGFAAVANMPQHSRIVGKNSCAPIPGLTPESAVSLNIYWVATITEGCKEPEPAYQVLRHFANPASDKMTSLAGANGVRLSTWRDAEIQKLHPHYSIIEAVHASSRTLPAIPEYPAVNEAISRAVHRTLHDEQSAEASLNQAATEVEQILGF